MAQSITAPVQGFDAKNTEHTFRIMANSFLAASLLGPFISKMISEYPSINFDLVSPSDVTLSELEQGQVEIAIDRFTRMPSSFYQSTLWRDNYVCMTHKDHPLQQHQDLNSYLAAEHIWLNRSGFGPEPLVKSREPQKLGWVDQALLQLGHRRNIRTYVRQHSLLPDLVAHSDMVATLPKRLAKYLIANTPAPLALCAAPFPIVPIKVSMLWSPLVHHNEAHQWLRGQITHYIQNNID